MIGKYDNTTPIKSHSFRRLDGPCLKIHLHDSPHLPPKFSVEKSQRTSIDLGSTGTYNPSNRKDLVNSPKPFEIAYIENKF